MNPSSEEDSSEMRLSLPFLQNEENFSSVSTANFNDSLHDYGGGTGRDENLAIVEIATLSVILFFAVLGNGFMLIALRKILQYRPYVYIFSMYGSRISIMYLFSMSRMYYFMLHLSLADLCVAIGNILPQLAWDITFRFKGPDLLCRLVKFLQVFVLYLSTYVLTSMAVDRYLVVCHHNFTRNYYAALRGPKVLIIMSYILSFILASPQAFLFSIKDVEVSEAVVLDCWVKFEHAWGAQAYVTIFVIFAFVLPFLIIGFSYGSICFKFVRYNLPPDHKTNKALLPSKSNIPCQSESCSEQTTHTQGSNFTNNQKVPSQRNALQRQISQAKIKTLKLTLVVVICFIVCSAPYMFTQMYVVYSSQSVGPAHVIMLLLASLNSCTNPWIYLAFSESLCNQLRVFLGLGLKRGSDEESIGEDGAKEGKANRRPANQEGLDLPKMNLIRKIRVHTSLSPPSEQGDNKPERETKSDVL